MMPPGTPAVGPPESFPDPSRCGGAKRRDQSTQYHRPLRGSQGVALWVLSEMSASKGFSSSLILVWLRNFMMSLTFHSSPATGVSPLKMSLLVA